MVGEGCLRKVSRLSFWILQTSTNVDFQCDPRLEHPKLLDYEHGVSDNLPQRFFGGSFEPSSSSRVVSATFPSYVLASLSQAPGLLLTADFPVSVNINSVRPVTEILVNRCMDFRFSGKSGGVEPWLR